MITIKTDFYRHFLQQIGKLSVIKAPASSGDPDPGVSCWNRKQLPSDSVLKPAAPFWTVDESSFSELAKPTKPLYPYPKCHHTGAEESLQGQICLRGQINGWPTQFLVDAGCTTTLLFKTLLDQLRNQVKKSLENSQSHGLLANGTQFPFDGII